MDEHKAAWRATIKDALLRITEERDAALVPYLIREIEDAESTIRVWALAQIGEYGDRATSAVPILRKLQADQRLGPAAGKALAAVCSQCSDECS